MTIVDKIINSIQAVLDWDEIVTDGNGVQTTVHHTFPVYYHNHPTLNLMTDGMQFPCALVVLLTTGRPVQEAGQLKEQVSAEVFFVEPHDCMDFNAVDNEAVIDRCKDKAFQWLMSLNTGDVELVSYTRSERIYGQYDDILTGYGVLAELKETIGIC